MKLKYLLPSLALSTLFLQCVTTPEESIDAGSMLISSPEGTNAVRFFLKEDRLGYLVSHKNQTVIDSSYVGFEFKDHPALGEGLEVLTVTKEKFDETWEMPWGEQRVVRNNYNELIIELAETEEPSRRFDVICRLYDDGLGFRFRFPEQENMGEVLITDENTQFALTGDHDDTLVSCIVSPAFEFSGFTLAPEGWQPGE